MNSSILGLQLLKERNLMTNLQPYLTAKDVSRVLRIGLSTVYAYVCNGALNAVELPHTRDSVAKKRNKKSIRFKVEDIQNFMDNLSK